MANPVAYKSDITQEVVIFSDNSFVITQEVVIFSDNSFVIGKNGRRVITQGVPSWISPHIFYFTISSLKWFNIELESKEMKKY